MSIPVETPSRSHRCVDAGGRMLLLLYGVCKTDAASYGLVTIPLHFLPGAAGLLM